MPSGPRGVGCVGMFGRRYLVGKALFGALECDRNVVVMLDRTGDDLGAVRFGCLVFGLGAEAQFVIGDSVGPVVGSVLWVVFLGVENFGVR